MAKDYDAFRMRLSHRIKELRLEKGITQEQMDEGTFGISPKTLQTVENEQREVYLSTLYRIARRLNVEFAELFKFKD